MTQRQSACMIKPRSKLQFAEYGDEETNFKRQRILAGAVVLLPEFASNPFDRLCDDVVLCILQSLCRRARSPSDLIAVSLTCKRFRQLATHTSVLASASSRAVVPVKASAWCQHAHNFVQRCADCGNVEACFTLGMIKFYCMEERREGIRLLLKAAMEWHAPALFALAIIQFNGSGGKAKDKNARAGVALCLRAALAGSVEATRELGHCLKEGHGLPKDATRGRRLLLQANRKEAINFINGRRRRRLGGGGRSCAAPRDMGGADHCSCRQRRLVVWKEVLRRSLLAECGCAFPLAWLIQNTHPAHVFLADWFAAGARAPMMSSGGGGGGGLRVCRHALCGRPETRPFEYRQCAACSSAFYCSRSCQSMDWKLRHMLLCHPSLPSDQ